MNITATAQKYAQLNGHRGAVYAVVPADIPHHVFTAGSDGIIARWDIENSVSSGALAQVQAPIFSLLYIENVNVLLAGREDGGLHIIDTVAKREIKLLKNHEKGVFSIICIGNKIYSAGGDGTVALIDADTFQTQHVFKVSDKKVRGLYFSEKRNLLYTASADGIINVFSTGSLSPVTQWMAHEGAANDILELSENTMISGGRDARLKVWDMAMGEPRLLENIPAHNFAIYQIQKFPELGILITCSRDKTIKIWDLESLQVLKRIERVQHGGHKNSVNSFVFFPEINKLVSVSDDATVMVWEIKIEK